MVTSQPRQQSVLPRVPGGAELGGVIVIVLAVTCWTHWPALSARARYFDDDRYISNYSLKYPRWATAARAVTEVLRPTVVVGYYHPLAILSVMVDHLWGGNDDDLFPFHVTSLALHLANVALVSMWFYLLFPQPWVAAAAGLVFGLHPQTVEAVAWVAERKTVLATFWALGTLSAYVLYARYGRRRWYGVALALYTLALLSKPTILAMPVLLLLLDYWPLRRCHRAAVKEKIPFLLLAVVAAVITYLSQLNTAFVTLPHQYPAGGVLLLICYNIVFYLTKFFWPVPVAPYYPFPQPFDLSHPAVLGGVVGTVGLLAALLLSLRWSRAVVVGWLFFFSAVFPALGIIGFTYTIAADRFAYFPMLGFLLPLVWLASEYLTTSVWRRGVALTALVIVTLLEMGGVRAALEHWQDPVEFYRYALEGAPNASPLLNNYGLALFAAGQAAAAADYFAAAIQVEPDNAEAHYNLGWLYAQEGQWETAATQCREALRVRPNYAQALNLLGLILYQQGDVVAAEDYYRRALAANVGYAEAYVNLGILLYQQQRLAEAIAAFQNAIALAPDEPAAYANLGTALLQDGRVTEAVEAYRRALQLNPQDGLAHNNLGGALMQQGQVTAAIEEFRAAVQLEPHNPRRHFNLARALEQAGQVTAAAEEYRRVLQLDPNNVAAQQRLATLEE